MRFVRSIALVVALVAACSGPAVVAAAQPDLFSQAVQSLRQEMELVPLANPAAPNAAIHRERLKQADATGLALLDAIRRTGIAVSAEVERTLDRLPAEGNGRLPLPTRDDYLAAIAELERLGAAHPGLTAPAFPPPLGNDAGAHGSGPYLIAGAGLIGLMVVLCGAWWTRRAHAEGLVAMAHTDALTGAANRRRLDDDLREIARGPRGALAVLMVDVDHFKSVNDAHGHVAGDEVLRRVARVIMAAVRPDDIVYRYGGEEFSVILRGASRAHARTVADRIRATIARTDMPVAGGVTASVGVASGRSDEIATMIDLADRALYASKHAGRDRVTMWADAMSRSQREPEMATTR